MRGVATVEDFFSGVLQNTFSIAVAAWLLVRMEGRLDGLTDAITRLQMAIERFFVEASAKEIGGAGGER
jgi:hypothetical protein